ncbi:MAG: DUF5668 domain-containing protein [Candidatus Berkelbacteria bacterium]
MKSGKFIWGLIIVATGIILLGISLGWWDQNIWEHILSYWPILLVLLGLAMMIDNGYIFIAIILVLGLGIFFGYKTNYHGFRDYTQKMWSEQKSDLHISNWQIN